MLSYIHAFHAGNYGDILKHAVFAFTLQHLLKKEKPFCVIDTHSGSGKYALDDERLLKTCEAQCGIQKLLKAPYSDLKKIFGKDFLSILELYVKKGLYPGSPEIARTFLRERDQLILNELHPKVFEELKLNIKSPALTQNAKQNSPSIILNQKDAKIMLNANIPPKIKRGCVIIDPSYEDADDYEQTAQMFVSAYKKWPTGTYLIWYPLLSHRQLEIEYLKQNVIATVEKTNRRQKSRLLRNHHQKRRRNDRPCKNVRKRNARHKSALWTKRKNGRINSSYRKSSSLVLQKKQKTQENKNSC